MSKRIGILGGISPESTSKYYDHIIKSYISKRNDYYFPEIVLFSMNFQRFTDYEDRGDLDSYLEEIMTAVRSLENADVDFFLMAANSPHAVFEKVEKQTKVPMLSIVKVVSEYAKSKGLKKLLLLGIRFTMQSSFYADECKLHGIEVCVPDLADQDEINRIIFEELSRGVFKKESRQKLCEIINKHKVDAVILGCTELPLILAEKDCEKPLINTLSLHAEAALDLALRS